MELVIERRAYRALKRLDPGLAEAMMTALEAIAAEPFAHHANVTRLKGTDNGFRLRHGKWRAVYKVDVKAQAVYVEDIGPRGSIYR